MKGKMNVENSPVTGIKIELGEESLKDIVLKYFGFDKYADKKFDQYLLMMEDGSPMFVIEEQAA